MGAWYGEGFFPSRVDGTHGGWFQGFQSAGCELVLHEEYIQDICCFFFCALFEHVGFAKSETIVVSITMVAFGPYVAMMLAKRLYRVCKGMVAVTHSEAEHRRGRNE